MFDEQLHFPTNILILCFMHFPSGARVKEGVDAEHRQRVVRCVLLRSKWLYCRDYNDCTAVLKWLYYRNYNYVYCSDLNDCTVVIKWLYYRDYNDAYCSNLKDCIPKNSCTSPAESVYFSERLCVFNEFMYLPILFKRCTGRIRVLHDVLCTSRHMFIF
jgi:hypothetical protein